MTGKRKYDIVIYGATGFTGQLVYEYLFRNAPNNITLAVAGRSKNKLENLVLAVKDSNNNKGRETAILIAASDDEKALKEIVTQSQIVITTVGPYSKYGKVLVGLCAQSGTHYLDLTGEAGFIRYCKDKWRIAAVETGAKIINSVGYDSIPSDIVTYLVAKKFEELGLKTKQVTVYQQLFGGAMSGGTAESMFTIAESGDTSGETDPYYLAPAKGKDKTDLVLPGYSKEMKGWYSPFVMATTNGKNVRHSAQVLNYGPDFSYREVFGPVRLYAALFMTISLIALGLILVTPLRRVLRRFFPAPGTGPSETVRNNSAFRTTAVGHSDDPKKKVKVRYDMKGDCGYGATSVMLSEAALCIACNGEKLPFPQFGGVFTPAIALGDVLVQRLKDAGVKITVEMI
eukprot:TRINITY_DN4788_c0_g1_i1.p1 TRINITY_DN4788_c0_g1~~TRINITY_DN4788_c0_g1_i1.p1  ORF type:complete len:418 (+),score=125.85 TRINITY_DN4788_c0_g1_i1:56-1255(+)